MGSDITDLPVGEIRPGDHAAFSFATAEEQAQVRSATPRTRRRDAG
jgi:hypothetical protein